MCAQWRLRSAFDGCSICSQGFNVSSGGTLGSGQTAWIPRLIWIYAVRTWQLVSYAGYLPDSSSVKWVEALFWYLNVNDVSVQMWTFDFHRGKYENLACQTIQVMFIVNVAMVFVWTFNCWQGCLTTHKVFIHNVPSSLMAHTWVEHPLCCIVCMYNVLYHICSRPKMTRFD